MSLIEYTLDGKKDKVKIALDRIKNFDPITNGFADEPYYVAYSGGKDSDVLRILFELSGLKYDLVHNHTTVDAPETIYYIRSIPNVQISYPRISMHLLIIKNGIPPTRRFRYCCAEFKENYGNGRFVSTGVRWEESTRRAKQRGSAEIQTKKSKNRIILNADNDESRRLFESCRLKGKQVINPIIDWNLSDVWEFLNHYGCKSNPLYEQGYTRIGCIGCPNGRKEQKERDFLIYPKYKQNYIRAFEKMILRFKEIGNPRRWETGEEVFDWWISDKAEKVNENQLDLFDFEESDGG